MPNLKEINLSDNNIWGLSETIGENSIMSTNNYQLKYCLKNLEILNLNNNKIDDLT